MKFIITENQKDKIVLNWMNKNFSPDQLEVVKSPKYPDSIFYKKNGIVVMEQDKKNEYFYFDYNEIWSFFESFFSMEYEEIQGVLKDLVGRDFQIEGIYTAYKLAVTSINVGRDFQIEGIYAILKVANLRPLVGRDIQIDIKT